MIGNPTITKEAYENTSLELKLKAITIAECSVWNGLLGSAKEKLSDTEILKLKAQIERDLIVEFYHLQKKHNI